MTFNYINLINALVVFCLVLINAIAAKKGFSGNFKSKYFIVDLFEQIGRYSSMAFMILPLFINGLEFKFSSFTETVIWLALSLMLLLIYIILWLKKPNKNTRVLYGLALVPIILFFINGIILRHTALIIASVIFGVSHLIIVKENV